MCNMVCWRSFSFFLLTILVRQRKQTAFISFVEFPCLEVFTSVGNPVPFDHVRYLPDLSQHGSCVFLRFSAAERLLNWY